MYWNSQVKINWVNDVHKGQKAGFFKSATRKSRKRLTVAKQWELNRWVNKSRDYGFARIFEK